MKKEFTILSIVGTRPEAIKMAPVVRLLEKRPDVISCLVSTSQHREMLDPFLKLFDLQPAYDLNIMRDRQSLPGIAHRTISGLESLFDKISPDFVLVQGDTTTAAAASMTAFYMEIPVGHVEAGLRSGNPRSPFPEEMNRRLISRMASLHFAPTRKNVDNLEAEGIREGVVLTGNTIVDALLEIVQRSSGQPNNTIESVVDGYQYVIAVTAHRRENHGSKMQDICRGLAKIAQQYPQVKIVFPVHLNPKVREVVFAELSSVENIALLDPLGYIDFVLLMQKSHIIISDSGGVQEEAPSLGKPVLVMRENTERPEGVEAGAVKLVGTDPDLIYGETQKLIEDSACYQSMTIHENLYGDGNAAVRICDAALEFLKKGRTT